ncbi:hypothetical protein [Cellulosimicrobium aquatile]|uniref:hypothetical protein n=1 Tax=Cellulosimicrobium aquatile TaxID=1612203 RepID=UPI0014599AEC|nr:hypothetical protein [Cellulosimicrobium aquatile]NMF28889.1 hypothetical protein [Cellulosimicrobium aquatile]
MPIYSFTMTVAGLDLQDGTSLDNLYTDAFAIVPSETDGVTSVSVEIDAPSGEKALERVTDFLHVRRVVVRRLDEDLVNLSEIAERLMVNRETVRTWARGHRKLTPFPAHRMILPGSHKLWTWSAIYAWALENGKMVEDEPLPIDESCVDWFNGTLVCPPGSGSPRRGTFAPANVSRRFIGGVMDRWPATAASSTMHSYSAYTASDGVQWSSVGEASIVSHQVVVSAGALEHARG